MSNQQQSRFGSNPAGSQHSRNYSGSGLSQQQQQQLITSFSYDSSQPPNVPSNSQLPATPQTAASRKQDLNKDDGDVAMEDADPYNRSKYPPRPTHSHRPSGQHLLQEESAAARRYSPMNALSPTSPYTISPQQSNSSAYSAYTPQTLSARQSPTRPNLYSSPSQQYYPSSCKAIMFCFIKVLLTVRTKQPPQDIIHYSCHQSNMGT